MTLFSWYFVGISKSVTLFSQINAFEKKVSQFSAFLNITRRDGVPTQSGMAVSFMGINFTFLRNFILKKEQLL